MKFPDHLEEWLIAFLMAVATIVVFIAVMHRYLSGWPIPGVQDALIRLKTSWAQETTVYMFAWIAKFGARLRRAYRHPRRCRRAGQSAEHSVAQ